MCRKQKRIVQKLCDFFFPLRRFSHTYVGGFLLSQLKFLLRVFKRLGVLVELILCSLELLLQGYQIVLKLTGFCGCFFIFGDVLCGQLQVRGDQQGNRGA